MTGDGGLQLKRDGRYHSGKMLERIMICDAKVVVFKRSGRQGRSVGLRSGDL